MERINARNAPPQELRGRGKPILLEFVAIGEPHDEARQNEEQVDAEEPAFGKGPPGVHAHHRKDREPAHAVERRIAQLYDELDGRGLRLRPKCFLSDEWLSPGDQAAVAWAMLKMRELGFEMCAPRMSPYPIGNAGNSACR